jgi:hypothetical protein
MPLAIRNPPEPKIERIANLVHRIQSGDIKIPKFQRGFVWDEDQIIKLLESIYEGYPIGSLLFWLSDKPMRSERDIGGFELPTTPDKYPRNYVLDGQQRLTTIYGPEQRGLCHLQFSQPVISKPMYWLFFSLTPIRKLYTGGYNYILVGVM